MHSALGSMVDHHGRVIHLRKNVAKCQPYRACTELANCYRSDSDGNACKFGKYRQAKALDNVENYKFKLSNSIKM
jgi:hypothetical protein